MGRFYLTLLLIILLAVPLWASLGKIVKNKILKNKAPKKHPLQNTFDPKKALEIFNENGSGGWLTDKVYETKDQKTVIMYGHAVCEDLLKKFPNKQFLKVRASMIYLPADVYKRGKKTKNVENEVILKGVLCYYGKDKNDHFFICNAPNDFYYVFELIKTKIEGSEPEYTYELNACVQIFKNKENYPKIEIYDTTEQLEADSIFGKFGFMPAKDKNHICSATKLEHKKPKDVCKKALKRKQNSLDLHFVSFDCVDIKMHRYATKKFEPIHPLEYEKGPKVHGAICYYNDETGKENAILIFNVSKKIDFYYVAEQVEKDIWTVHYVMNIQ